MAHIIIYEYMQYVNKLCTAPIEPTALLERGSELNIYTLNINI